MDNQKLWQSQNFLKNPQFVASLIEKTNIGSDDVIVEIGPGKGVITQQLANKVLKVIGVEFDHNLAASLKSAFSKVGNIEIVEADFLKWGLPRYPYKIFANIPFNLTAGIVNKLLTSSNSPEAAYLIMQDRAAERFIGQPVGLNSQTSILLQPFWEMKIVTKIDKRQFEPIPNINAVLAKFVKRREALVDPELTQQYRDFVVYGYNQWQPTVLDAFRGIFSPKQIDIISKRFNISGLKPSGLTADQWIGLFNTYLEYVPERKKTKVGGAQQNLKLKQKGMRKQHRTRER